MRHLNQFMAEFADGFQQSTRFEVQVYPPQGLIDGIVTSNGFLALIDQLLPSVGGRIDQTFSASRVANWLARGLLCVNAHTPDRMFSTTDLSMYGFSEKFPYHSEFPVTQLTFAEPLVANDNAVPRFFNYWLNYIQNAQNGIQSGMDFRFPAEYYGTLFVSQFDRKMHETITYKFERAYPTQLQSVPMSWDASNQFQVFQVQFNYSWWQVMPYQPPPLIEVDIDLSR